MLNEGICRLGMDRSIPPMVSKANGSVLGLGDFIAAIPPPPIEIGMFPPWVDVEVVEETRLEDIVIDPPAPPAIVIGITFSSFAVLSWIVVVASDPSANFSVLTSNFSSTVGPIDAMHFATTTSVSSSSFSREGAKISSWPKALNFEEMLSTTRPYGKS
jgi:hypothetical protein